jgi:hypothetical protein
VAKSPDGDFNVLSGNACLPLQPTFTAVVSRSG